MLFSFDSHPKPNLIPICLSYVNLSNFALPRLLNHCLPYSYYILISIHLFLFIFLYFVFLFHQRSYPHLHHLFNLMLSVCCDFSSQQLLSYFRLMLDLPVAFYAYLQGFDCPSLFEGQSATRTSIKVNMLILDLLS